MQCDEILDTGDPAGVNTAQLDRGGEGFDATQRLLRPFHAAAGHGDGPIVLDFDRGPGRILDPRGSSCRPVRSRGRSSPDRYGSAAAAGLRGRSVSRPGNGRSTSAGSRCGPWRPCLTRERTHPLADAVDLEVQLDAGDAVLRAGHLEIHVAVVVLIADDIGQQGPAIRFLDQADRNAGNRVADWHSGGHESQRRAADGWPSNWNRSTPGCRK